MKPLLFISHSAKDEPAEKALDVLHVAFKKDWDVFIDRERLTPGEKWRDQIHTALAVCDAAIILFSKEAYEDSEWVLKEATIFSWRKALDDSFRFVCALFPEVNPEMLSKDRYKAAFVGELLWADATKPDFIKRVKKGIGKPATEAPGQRMVSAIASRFKDVREKDLKVASARLGKTLDWDPKVDRYERFARNLLHASLPEVRAALREVSTFLHPEDINEINRYLIPFAIDAVAASKIPKAALGDEGDRRAFVVNASEKTTGEHYVQRAHCHPDPWTVVELANAGGHDTRASLKNEMLTAISDQTTFGNTEKEIAGMLDQQLEDKSPVFVIVHGPVDKKAIGWLRSDFPACTFIVLAGETFNQSKYASPGIDVLVPQLAKGQETAINQHFKSVEQIAVNRAKQRK